RAGSLGSDLVRLHEDGRRAHERPEEEARGRSGVAEIRAHGSGRRLSLRVSRRARRVSFRARLVLAAAYLVTAVVLALEIPLALNIKRRAEADFRSSVFGQAALLSARTAHGGAAR